MVDDPRSDRRRQNPPGRPEAGLEGLILVVEDGSDCRSMFAHYLRAAGAGVEVADDGAQACAKALAAAASGAPFDVILMDMQMPGIDGYRATARLRAAGYTRRIVALTALACEGDRERCRQAGCDDVAAKPIDPDRLVEIARQHLGGRRGTGGTWAAARAGAHASQPIDDTHLAALVETFVGGLAARAAAMELSLAAGDAARLAAQAHQLKGTAGAYGFPAMTEAAAALEASAGAGAGIDELRRRVGRLAALCRLARGSAT